MKKTAIIALLLIVSLMLSACTVTLPFLGTRNIGPPTEYIDLTGQWVQSNSHNDGKFQGIYITGDYIEVYWVFDDMSGATLYWAGTFKADTNWKYKKSFKFKSKADTSRTTLSLLSTQDTQKVFRYEDGRLTYDVTRDVNEDELLMHVTAEKGDWGMDTLRYRGIIDMFDVVNLVYEGSWENKTFPEFHIGETWNVPGQWNLTITDVNATEMRNQYFEREPRAVYVADYTYENLGWSDYTGLGLQFFLDENIVDCIGNLGYGYPLTTQSYPRQIARGETCEAQDYIAVENPGTFRLTIIKADAQGTLHGAIFIIDID